MIAIVLNLRLLLSFLFLFLLLLFFVCFQGQYLRLKVLPSPVLRKILTKNINFLVHSVSEHFEDLYRWKYSMR